MGIKKATGLRGLQGIKRWDALTEKEKEEYLKKYPSLRGKSVYDVSLIHDNTNYIDEFGLDDFYAHPDKEERDARLKHTIVEKTRNELWGDGYESLSDDENNALREKVFGLTDDGFIDLVDTGKFLFPSESPKFDKEAKMDQLVEEEYGKAKAMFLPKPSRHNDWYEGIAGPTPALGGIIAGGKLLARMLPDGWDRNNKAIDAAVARDVDRKGAMAAPVASQYRAAFDQMPVEDFEKLFSEVYEGQEVKTGYGDGKEDYKTPGIGLYKEFKNQDEMAGFGLSDKKKMLANYFAIRDVFQNPMMAEQSATTALQNYIHENQDAWDWWGSAIRGMTGKTVASFGQLVLGAQAAGNTALIAYKRGWDAADKWLANFMQGKREDGTDRRTLDNIVYWNGIDQFGVIPGIDDIFGEGSATEVERIVENGGISHYNWLAPAGQERNLSSAVNEGLKMAGYMAAQMAVGKGVGLLGKGAAKLAGGAFSEVTGLYNAAWSTPVANHIMKYATPLTTSALNAIPISVGYAKGSFDEVLREATDRANYEAEKWAQGEFNKFEKSFNEGIALTKEGFSAVKPDLDNSESAQVQFQMNKAIADEMNQWVVKKYNNLVANGADPKSINVAAIYNDAIEKYKDYKRNQLLNKYKEGEQYKAMMDAAQKEAASAYERNATIEFIRMCGINYAFRQWQQDKSVRAAMNANYPNLDVVEKNGRLVATGKLFGEEISTKAARWIQPVKSLWSGFESNYMDDVTAAYAKGFSLGRYNDYVDQIVANPDTAAATVSWMAGFTNALSEGKKMFTDPQAWYDGFIGALGYSWLPIPAGSSLRGVFTRQGRSGWRAKFNYNQAQIADMASQYGLSMEEYINGEFEKWAERVHPEHSEAQVQEVANKERAKNGLQAAINDGRIESVSLGEKINSILYNPILNQYKESAERERSYRAIVDGGNKAIAEKRAAIEDMIRVVYTSNRKAASNKSDSIYEGKEAKAEQAFALVSMMTRWAQDPILSKSEFVKNSWAKIEKLADGSVDDADVADFYASVDNKSERERPDANEFAKQRLISNAKQLVKMRESYEKAQKKVKDSKQFRVIAHHNAVDYVTEHLAFSYAMNDSRKERQAQMRKELGLPSSGNVRNNVALYGSEDTARDAVTRIGEEIEGIDKQIQTLKDRITRKDKNATRAIRRLRRESSKLEIQELERQKEVLEGKRSQLKTDIENKVFDKTLSKEEILSLSPEELATMLDSKNAKLYSKEQKAQIEEAKRELKERDSDALEKIQDLAKITKDIEDTNISRSIMEDNLEAAADYFAYAQVSRARRLENALIDNHYRRIEKAMDAAKDDAGKIMLAKTLSVQSLDRYLKDHPEHTELLKGVVELAKLEDDIRASLRLAVTEEQEKIRARVREDNNEDTDADVAAKEEEQKVVESMAQAIEEEIFGTNLPDGKFAPGIVFHQDIKNEQDLMGVIEELAERNTDPKLKALYEGLLRNLEEANHTRNATVVQSRKEKEAQRQKQEEYNKKQDGKNFGWDGYKVGDTVYHKDGRRGEVQGFIPAKEGESNGAIKVWWVGNKSGDVVVYTDKSLISKTVPKDSKAPDATAVQEVPNNIETNAEEEEEAGEEWTEDGGLITPTEEEEYNDAVGETDASPMNIPDISPLETGSDKEIASKDYRADEGLLEGNGLYEYSVDALKDIGIVERRVPKESGDKLDNFFKWLDKEHIQLQEIVDRIVSQIYQQAPNTKIQFMISNDPLTSQQVLQVVEVTDKIEKIYDKANEEAGGNLGGIVVATDGHNEKRYLIVGTTYSHIGIGFYNFIGNPLKAYIEKHPSTKYYVHPDISSKIAKIDNGRLVRQQLGEDRIQYRTLSELFADKSRNPYGLSFENAVFGIVYKGKGFVPNRTTSKTLLPPSKRDASIGRVFIMIPSASGALVPVALKTDVALNSPELKRGELTNIIERLLRKATSKVLAERKEAVKRLGRLIKFNSEGGKVIDGLLVGSKDVNNITLMLKGEKIKSWNLDDVKFDTMDFINTVMHSPFNIRVTQNMLNPDNVDTLKMLDEAGVLKTDVSALRTVNVGYQIFPVDASGKEIKKDIKKIEPNPYKTGPSETAYATKINDHTYRLRQGDYIDEFGKRVDDQALRTSIRYNLIIQRNGLRPSYTSKETGLSYYVIVNNEDNPTIVGRDSKGNIQVLSKDSAVRMLKAIKERAEIERRRAAAEEEMRRLKAGEEGFNGEEGLYEEEGKPEEKEDTEAPEKPERKLTFIEPKHNDKVTFGPAIRRETVFIKHWGDIEMELHTETTTDDNGNKKTIIVGWDTKGNNFTMPLLYMGQLFDIPDGYRAVGTEGFEIINIRGIYENADGTLSIETLSKSGDGYLLKYFDLQRIEDAAQPKSEEKPAEDKVPETPKSDYDPNKAKRKNLKELGSAKKTTTFVSVYGKHRTALNEIAKEKGWDWGKTTKEKEEFLKKKLGPSFNPNMITDVDTFIDNIRSCK